MGAFLASLGAIILVDLTLSGDNALVIGAAAAGLSRRRRLLAILAGGGAAIVLRILFATAATLLLQLPLLQAIGGIVLLIIAVRLLLGREGDASSADDQAGGKNEAKGDQTFVQALLTILVADLTMSLDNILAVGGLAQGNIELLVIGLAVSIALLMVGSAIVAELIGRIPILLDFAALTLGWTAGTMALNDFYAGPYVKMLPYASIAAPVLGVALVLVIDIVFRVRSSRRTRHQHQQSGDGERRPTEATQTR